MKKLFFVGKGKALSYFINALRMSPEHDFYNLIETESTADKLLTFTDLAYLKECDCIVTWGTWGSTSPRRKWQKTYDDGQPVLHLKDDGVVSPKYGMRWNETLNLFAVDLAKMYNKKHLVFESATLSRIRNLYSSNKDIIPTESFKRIHPHYYRMGVGHWTYGKARWCTPKKDNDDSRLNMLANYNGTKNEEMLYKFSNHEWTHKKDGKIYIFPGLEHDPTSNGSVSDWVENSVSSIRKVTDRPIIIKPHPLSSLVKAQLNDKEKDVLEKWKVTTIDHIVEKYDNVEFISKTIHLSELKDMYCAVIESSTSIFEITHYGIPCITSYNSFGFSLGNYNLDKIENLNLLNSDQMKKWYIDMSFTEFSEHELMDGLTILPYFEELFAIDYHRYGE